MWHPNRIFALLAGTLMVLACLLSPQRANAVVPHWTWPLATVRVTRDFQAPVSAYGAGHRGIDFVADAGTPLYAPARLRVEFAGMVASRSVVTLGDGDSWQITFDSAIASVPSGSWVDSGELVAHVSASAHCGVAACVHIGVRWHGQYVSPLLVFGELPHAVLLPW